jgi:O-antigen/teichoic acid export membrane protein
MVLRKNIIANFLGRIYQAGAIYLFIPLYVRLLGSEAFGLIAFQSILLTACSLLDVGLSSAFAREVAQGKKATLLARLFGTVERILLLTSIFVAGILAINAEWIAGSWLKPSTRLSVSDVQTCILLMIAMLPFQILNGLYSAGIIGYQKQVLSNSLTAVSTTLRSGLVIPVIYIFPDIKIFFLWQLAMTIAFAMVFRSALVGLMSIKWYSIGDFSLASVKPIMRFTGGMLAISLISTLNTQLDKIIVSKIFSIDDLGRYALAFSLAQLPVILSSPVLVAAYPRITELLTKGSTRNAERVYESISFIVASLSSTAAVTLLLFASDLLAVWLGSNMLSDDILSATRILAFGGLFLALASTPFYLGLANQHNRTSILLGIFTTAALGPIVIFGAKNFGISGAALAWPLLNAAALIMLSYVIHRLFYRGSRTRWWVVLTLCPVGVAIVAILPFKLIAQEVEAAPALGCVLACFGSLLAILLLSRLHRRLSLGDGL